VTIFETGCVRAVNDFGAGSSTVIFDRLLETIGHGFLTSVDITPSHVELAQGLVRYKNSEVLCDDSLSVLSRWSSPIDLLYLDSFDLDVNNDTPSAEHHLKELKLAWNNLRRPAMLAIDDNFSGEYRPLGHRYKGSKGRLVREHLAELGYRPVLDLHQTVWIVS
jgi:predicted O-methyltransferase YrrM